MLKVTSSGQNGKNGENWVCANTLLCSGLRGTLPPPPEQKLARGIVPFSRRNNSKLIRGEPLE